MRYEIAKPRMTPPPATEKIVLIHPTGNEFSRNAALAFHEAGILREFWTAIAWNPHSRFARLFPRNLREQLERRSFSDEIGNKLKTHPWREAGRLISARLKWSRLTAHEKGIFSVDSVYRELDAHVAQHIAQRPDVTSVYAYEDGALSLFQAARRAGQKCIYDLPIGYWRAARKIQQEEAQLKPEWASTLSANLDSAQKLDRKDQELQLANRIIVASTFTWKTLSLSPVTTTPIQIVPYGAPEAGPARKTPRSGPLRVLFTGILGQRKGIAYLFEAVNRLGKAVELTLLGQPAGKCAALEQELKKHRWIKTLPHAKVLEEMDRQDVLVFPSLFEGFGLVILEAMSRGLAVITTPHTAGPDLISDGNDGFIIPIRSSEAIFEKLELLHQDRTLLQSVSDAARETARRHSWTSYRNALVNAATHSRQTRFVTDKN